MYTFNIDPKQNEYQFDDYSYIFITLRGVFLALLIFCASFLAPYIGCNYQELLKYSKTTRYIFLFLIIYFSINLIDPNSQNKENPIIIILKSFIVMGIFVILNNIDITSILLVLTLFALLIFTYKYYVYIEEVFVNKDGPKGIKDLLLAIQLALSISIGGILILSVVLNRKNKTLFVMDKCNL